MTEKSIDQLRAELHTIDRIVQATFQAFNSSDFTGSILITGTYAGKKFNEVISISHQQPETVVFFESLSQNYYHKKLLLTKELAEREEEKPSDPPASNEAVEHLIV